MKVYCLFTDVDEGYPILQRIFKDKEVAESVFQRDLELGRQYHEAVCSYNQWWGSAQHPWHTANPTSEQIRQRVQFFKDNPGPTSHPDYMGYSSLEEKELE